MNKSVKRCVIGESKIVDVDVPVPLIVDNKRSGYSFKGLVGPFY